MSTRIGPVMTPSRSNHANHLTGLVQKRDARLSEGVHFHTQAGPTRETHVNRSFSRDGRRLYFYTSVSPDPGQAAYFDILSDLAAGKEPSP